MASTKSRYEFGIRWGDEVFKWDPADFPGHTLDELIDYLNKRWPMDLHVKVTRTVIAHYTDWEEV